jgi:hypothetical protein
MIKGFELRLRKRMSKKTTTLGTVCVDFLVSLYLRFG